MKNNKYQLISKYSPTGDQPQAIEELVDGVNSGLKSQVLLGVTGSGKTFTMANVIARTGRSALVLAHNKTLAAQLCNEFREFFPHNRVEFFVSYYDYYQPEAYIVSTDTYIEKDMAINDEIDKLRHSATASLLEADDVIVVSSVSCIYGLGAPEEYYSLAVSLRQGQIISPKEVVRKLVNIQYERNDVDFSRSCFRMRGDTIEVFPASATNVGVRIEFFGDEIEKISEFEVLTGKVLFSLSHAMIFPATHYAVGSDKLKAVLNQIENDKIQQVENFKQQNKLLEAQRLEQRVSYDLEMMSEMGYCNGIENYSRYFDGRNQGDPPYTLLDYFKKDFLLFVDESHITIPQIRGMFNGDKARKQNLVDYGFRLTSAYDNRPLNFEEFNERIGQVIYVSATPASYEMSQADNVVEQIIRPTGLLDPEIEVRETEGQIENLIDEINKVTKTNGRVLITTLTKKMAESLTKYLTEFNIKVRYLHSEIDTMERIEIVNALRSGEFDVLIGINLLREGLDIPEVKLVAILDADKEGFLRSTSSLIQIVGRAARNSEARVLMYANTITDSMKNAIDETNRRRQIQNNYNIAHNIIPKTIFKEIKNTLEISKQETDKPEKLSPKQKIQEIEKLTTLMNLASASLDFEQAIALRDEIAKLKQRK